jgi:hypothetical protein
MEGSCEYVKYAVTDSRQRMVLQLGGWELGYQLAVKNKLVAKWHIGPPIWTDSLYELPKLREMDLRFGTWNERNLYRAGSLMTVAKEISKYKFDLAGVEVRWDVGGTKPAGELYIFFYGKGMRIMN